MKSRFNAPIIVVSNRLPFILVRNEDGSLERKQCAGGLVTAVCPSVIECNGKWIGWPGIQLKSEDEVIPESNPDDKSPTAGLLSDQVEPVQVEPKIFDKFYNGCCNGTFWPLFHSMPDRATFSNETYEAYKQVNDIFAEKILKALRKCLAQLDDEGRTDAAPLIWIHDYQLMLAATTVRRVAEDEGLRCKMSFFMHIPFPSWDIMRIFPWDDEILEGILGCDLVGFHIDDYCLNFLDCCQRRLGCRVDRNRFLCELDGRTIHVKSLPIGIPYSQFAEMSRNAPKVLKEKDQQIILGVDRLDYTKGLVNRVKAFERLLEKHPEHIEKCILLQVAVPSRTDVKEYQALKEEMDQLIGRINGRFSKPNWSPIRYIYGCISQEQLSAFYRDSAVAMVTPLRDGMNLVAKEFVACQNLSDPGVLILSPFAGAGGMMQEALIVNPYEIEEFADKLHRGLQMPFDERLLRMKHLQRREQAMDVTCWLNTFLSAVGILPCDNYNLSSSIAPLTVEDFEFYLSDYLEVDQMNSAKLSLILDYDGTLAPIAQKPELAHMPEETKCILRRLALHTDDVSICIISGRSLVNLKEVIGIDGITYAASHGLEILSPDGTKYHHPITTEHEDRISGLVKALQQEVGKDGAWIENKGALLTFHYREVPRQARNALISRATEIFIEHGFQPHKAPMALEAKPEVKWDRGRASIHILRTTYGADWSSRVRVIYCGDDQSDEEAMQALSGIAVTFKVSSMPSTRTSANYRLRSPAEVLLMLRWVEMKISQRRSPSPTSPTRLNRASVSFDDTSDDEMRRLRTNSRGRTQNIYKTGNKNRKTSENGVASRSSPDSFPELPPSPPRFSGVSLNRHL
ncbi:Bifunctional trehalose-6-phosphate synthase/phosphatase [Orchesella cincta]|uniref:Bifunctional trehalose-6-phosphate synthase/phosphatase n=1 Tax=Orchesella cincta TaxID=48709 RepID=A0A1D2NJ69_ORCCI|nr:Bifunctional trehalose-6-phosphate synthase/phosphatase [Orchesella cincta]